MTLKRMEVPVEFNQGLMAQAGSVQGTPPPDPDAGTRRDLTHLTVYAIDDEGTREAGAYPRPLFGLT